MAETMPPDSQGKEEIQMREVTNLDHKRICDVSADARVIEIRRKDCVTRITANPNGTLSITHEREGQEA